MPNRYRSVDVLRCACIVNYRCAVFRRAWVEQQSDTGGVVRGARNRTLIVVVSAISVGFIFFYLRTDNSATANSSSQGCVNQGKDRRFAAPVICWAQRHMSWKSNHKPDFLLIGNPKDTSIGLAWPPYFVLNSPAGKNRWYMFRIGFRYDRNWHGYIFPTIAWKIISKPLRY